VCTLQAAVCNSAEFVSSNKAVQQRHDHITGSATLNTLIAEKCAYDKNCTLLESVLTVNTAIRYTAVFNKPTVYNTVALNTAVFFMIRVYRASLPLIIIIIIINVKINVGLSENASRTRYTIKIKLKLRKCRRR